MPKKKTIKIIKWLATIISLLVMLVILTGVIFRLYYNDSRLRSLLVSEAGKYLNAEISIGDININLLSSIAIDNFYITGTEGDTIVGCESAKLNYDIFKLISGELSISGFETVKPEINLRTDKNGEIDFSWLKLSEDTTTENQTAETDTTTTSLPLKINISSFIISEASINLSGVQNIALNGLNIEGNDFSIAAVDSITGSIRFYSKGKTPIIFSYSYKDSLGGTSMEGNIYPDCVFALNKNEKANGNIKFDISALKTEVNGYTLESRINLSSNIAFDVVNGDLDISSIRIDYNGKRAIEGELKTNLFSTAEIPPLDLNVKKFRFSLDDFSSLLERQLPKTKLRGILSGEDLSLANGGGSAGLVLSGQISASDINLNSPELGIKIENTKASLNYEGSLFSEKPSIDFDVKATADSLIYALDESTKVVIPSIDFKMSGTADSEFTPTYFNGNFSANGLFGDTLRGDISLKGGLPPKGILSVNISSPAIEIDKLPYSEIYGFLNFNLTTVVKNSRADIKGDISATELLIEFEDDSLFIPELPLNFVANIDFNDDFSQFMINRIAISSPSLFDISGAGELSNTKGIKLTSTINGTIYHNYLEDFIPSVLRDSLGTIDFSGESSIRANLHAEIDDADKSTIRATGTIQTNVEKFDMVDYAIYLHNLSLSSDYAFVNGNFASKNKLKIGWVSIDDSLMAPLKDINGGFRLSLKDSVLSWNNVDLEIISHKTKLSSSGKYVVSDNPILSLNANIDFAAKDTINFLPDIAATGRLQGYVELSMADDIMEIRGSINPRLLSIISPGVFAVISLDGSIPFYQRLSLTGMRILGDTQGEYGLNLLKYEQDKFYGKGGDGGELRFERLEAGRVHIDNFDLTVRISSGRITAPRVYSEVYGGNLLGDFYLDLRGMDLAEEEISLDSLRYALNLQLSGVNFDRLAGSGKISQSSEISGDMSFKGRGIVDPKKDFELEGQVNITKIGPKATKKLLDFLDPTGTDISIAETRKLMDRRLLFLDISYQPKSFSIKVKHGNINPSINMDQPFFAKYLRIGAVTMPVEYDRKQLRTMLKAAEANVLEQ